jgi:hypothetical protein
VENSGQTDPRAMFYARGADMDVFFTASGLTFAIGRSANRHAVRAEFLDAEPAAPRGVTPAPTVVSFFRGPKSEWKTGLRTFREIAWRGVWPGIDLVVSAEGDSLKSLWTVAPGADPSRIAISFSGPESMRVTAEGDLLVSTPRGTFRDGRPVAWQTNADGHREPVAAAHALERADGAATWRAGFELGGYDPGRPLSIDPVVLTYSGFIGTGPDTIPCGISLDWEGCAYVCGSTSDAAPVFPADVGPYTSYTLNTDAFVAKVSEDGTHLRYAGFIGGTNFDCAQAIAVDSSRCAYLVGETYSTETTFPVVTGPDLTYNGNGDAFLVKVTAGGTGLEYAGYLGGENSDKAYAVAVDSSSRATFAGTTMSGATSFPATTGPGLTYSGGTDGFIARVNANGASLVYAGYIGGGSFDEARAVAVDSSTGSAFVVGSTRSTEGSFPVVLGPDLTYNGGYDDAFAVKVKADGTAFDWAGYIGGVSEELAFGVAVAPGGAVVVAGRVHTNSTGFPVATGPDLTANGDWDSFVMKLDSSTAGILWSGYVGGSGSEYFGGLALDSQGNAYVAATTGSTASFPVLVGPGTHANGSSDVCVTKVSPDGTGLIYSGFLGGAGGDSLWEGGAIVVSGTGAAYVTGRPGPAGKGPGFPVLAGPELVPGSGTFVTRISTPATDILLNLSKGSLSDTTKPGGDSMKVTGTFAPLAGWNFSPQALPTGIRLGDGADPIVFAIPAGDPGFKAGKGKLSWKGAAGSLKLDLGKGKFSIAAKKADFPAPQENPIRVWLDFGGQTFLSSLAWTEDAERPGSYRFP